MTFERCQEGFYVPFPYQGEVLLGAIHCAYFCLKLKASLTHSAQKEVKKRPKKTLKIAKSKRPKITEILS